MAATVTSPHTESHLIDAVSVEPEPGASAMSHPFPATATLAPLRSTAAARRLPAASGFASPESAVNRMSAVPGLCDDARVTVLIVDDHAGFRATARALLQAEGFDVV